MKCSKEAEDRARAITVLVFVGAMILAAIIAFTFTIFDLFGMKGVAACVIVFPTLALWIAWVAGCFSFCRDDEE